MLSNVVRVLCLGGVVVALAVAPARAYGSATTQSATQGRWADDPLVVVFFYQPGCSACQRVSDALDGLVRRFGADVRVNSHNIQTAQGLRLLLRFNEAHGVTDAKVPVVFVGDRWLMGDTAILEGLDDAIAHALAAGPPSRPATAQTALAAENPGPADQDHSSPPEVVQFGKLTVGLIALAGLVDGVNPCAFATIAFLVSMLAYLGKSRGQMVVVGVGFALAIFATYLALGVGLLAGVRAIVVRYQLFSAVAYVVAGLAFALAAWSMLDFIRLRRSGQTSSMSLGLPDWLRRRVNRVIRMGLSGPRLLAGSMLTGVVVALLESICTGQIYVPTIMVVVGMPELRARAVAYLVLYNVMFIVPLVGVLVLAVLGVGNQRIRDFARRHVGLAKLALAVMFVLLGVAVLLTA